MVEAKRSSDVGSTSQFFCVKRNQLDTKGTAGLAASVERLPEMEGMGDR
jgi:hypothetical protein